ncbi:MAG: four helix bundle protein [Desulfobacterales bacterium]|nr:four helix bundle protein [Desulfobacterales bacterium]
MEKRATYRGYRDLKVYQLSYKTALEIHEITKTFPREEKYSLTDQIRRSSRSVPGNIAEAWKKRRYKKSFISKVIDSAGEAGETEVWLDFSLNFGYIDASCHKGLLEKYGEINRMLNGMVEKADIFCTLKCKQ